MRRAGIPQVIRMKISGHKTDSMERRYNVADDEDIMIAKMFMNDRMSALAKDPAASKEGDCATTKPVAHHHRAAARKGRNG
jgi:hypothetical protein